MATSKKRPPKNQKNASSNANKDKLTLKYWLIGFLIVAAVTGIVVLISFFASRTYAVPFTMNEGSLVRDSDGMVYLKAPAMYQVDAYTKNSEKRYGEAGNISIYKVGYKNEYNVVVSLDEDQYLTDGKGTLYYSSAVTLPTLATFDTKEVSMGTIVTGANGTTVTFLKTLTDTNSPDATDFVEEFLEGKRYLGEGIPEQQCRLKLTSSKYPYLSYIMTLVRCHNGDFYVYTDQDRSSIQVDSSWFGNLWVTDDSDAPTTSTAPETTAVPQKEVTP